MPKQKGYLALDLPLIFVPVAANSYPQLIKEHRWHQGIHCIIWTPQLNPQSFSEELDDFDIENIRILSCLLELLLPTLEAIQNSGYMGDLSETPGRSCCETNYLQSRETDLLSALVFSHQLLPPEIARWIRKCCIKI